MHVALGQLAVPMHRQEFPWSCGAAAARIALLAFGHDVPEAYLRLQLGTNPQEGTEPNAIVAHLNAVQGLQAEIQRMTVSDLCSCVDRGEIVIVDLQAWSEGAIPDYAMDRQDGHYVVLSGYGEGRLYFSDPANAKPVHLSMQDLDERWHDVTGDGQYFDHLGIVVMNTKPAQRVASRYLRRSVLAAALESKRWGGFTFKIDRPKGYVKTWDQPDGSIKKYKYPVDYGYFVGHTGEDDEGLDAFVGSDPTAKIESFLKLKPSDDDPDELVPDETKFLIGLTDAEREKVMSLYEPENVTEMREYKDVYSLIEALTEYRTAKKVASRYRSAAEGKYDSIDFKPPQTVADQAEKGLKLRQKASPSNKGGLSSQEAGAQGIGSGVQRAVNLKNRDNVTPETIGKMLGFFARHEKNKSIAPENRDTPWNDKGYVAWLLWGGDAGWAWAKKVKEQMERADAKGSKSAKAVAAQYMTANLHGKNIELMKFLSSVSARMGFGEHVYVVGGAVRNFVIKQPIKDIDLLVDQIALGHTSEWVAQQIAKAVPVETSLVTNAYGVAILTVKGDWDLGGHNMAGEVIEIAAARKESYGGEGGKGYKPDAVEPATVEEDVVRREFTFNTLLWRLLDLTHGPDRAQIIDITGCGMRDLQEGTMQCPADPDKVFGDDPSRLIRIVKFVSRYGFKLTPDTEAAAKRQAPKLRNVPHNAVSKLLAEVLVESKAKQAIALMDHLGLLDVVREMVQEVKPFREALNNWGNSQSVQYMFTLMDIGLVTSAKVGFLTPAQQSRVRDLAADLSAEDAEEFLAVLKQPGKVISMGSIGAALGLSGAGMGTVQTVARQELLANPSLRFSPAKWEAEVQSALKGGSAKQAGIFAPPSPERVAKRHLEQ
jgi:tRNA nucleotidyltransferase/poly(A) polymerase